MIIRAIALNTWRETMRDRILVAAVLVMGLGMAAALCFEGPGPGRAVAVLDLGLTLMSAIGVLLAIFLGTSLVHKEMDKRTLYVVLTKPVTRFQFLAGKYLGLMATLTLMVALMGLMLLGLMVAVGHLDGKIFAVLAAQWMQLSLLTALAFCFSCVTSGVLAALYAGGIFLVGQQTHVVKEFAESEILRSMANFVIGNVMYVALPNFSVFDYKNAALYGNAIPWDVWALGLLYGALMSAGCLVMASVAWQARELP